MKTRLSAPQQTANRPGCDHPTTLLLCVHKAASTFLTTHFAPAMSRAFPGMQHIEVGERFMDGASLETLALPPRGVVASRVYPRFYHTIIESPEPEGGRFADKKLILLRRDPRDAAVSFYYSLAYSHDLERVEPPDVELRRTLREADVATGIAEHIAWRTIRQFLLTVEFVNQYPQTCLTTYETLVTDFPRWLAQVRTHMGWTEAEAERVGRGLDREFEAPAEENPNQHKRRITPGNWRDIFDDRLRSMFEEEAGKEMRDAGYTW